MIFNYEPYFLKYEQLSKTADAVFDQVKSSFPSEVLCHYKCADCCHAIFDITLIEAIYINFHFLNRFSDKKRESIIEKSNRADRQVYKLKHTAFKEFNKGKEATSVLIEMAGERIRCPLLNDKELCDLYDYRPITCRFYGIPVEIAGIAHTCGKSGFVKGRDYPAVHVEKMQRQLFSLSNEVSRAVGAKFAEMGNILVPVSMALLTEYNEEYFGIK